VFTGGPGVELRDIGKYFPSGGIRALEGASFELRPGEIHALLGENGAGKSTLMHVLAGYQRPETGRLLVDGVERRFTAPADALAAGIGMVRQHPRVTGDFYLWEDCILGAEPRRGFLLDRKRARNRVRELSQTWGFDLSPDQKTGSLTVSRRQTGAILSLLLREVEYFIFDEPTAVLSPGETANLFRLIRRLAASGKGVVLISHKLDETLALADRVTILRRGRTVAAALPAGELSAPEAGALMFGREGGGGVAENPGGAEPRGDRSQGGRKPAFSWGNPPAESRPPFQSSPGLLIFAAQGLWVQVPGRPLIRGIDLVCPPGRILGIAGVRDSGLETLELALTGFLAPERGRILLQGRDIGGRGVRAFREAGGAYLNTDRAGGAAALELPIRDSLIIHAARRAPGGIRGGFGLMDQSGLDSWCRGLLEQAGLSLSLRRRGDSLSGGMLQRLALAREFAEEAPFLVLAEPGWGLDRPGREALYQRLREYVRPGRGVLLFSTDVEELTGAADEILVLRNGVFAGPALAAPPVGGDSAGGFRELLGRLMAGAPREAACG
jgi:simple sugar transport system ATP-binding protein